MKLLSCELLKFIATSHYCSPWTLDHFSNSRLANAIPAVGLWICCTSLGRHGHDRWRYRPLSHRENWSRPRNEAPMRRRLRRQGTPKKCDGFISAAVQHRLLGNREVPVRPSIPPGSRIVHSVPPVVGIRTLSQARADIPAARCDPIRSRSGWDFKIPDRPVEENAFDVETKNRFVWTRAAPTKFSPIGVSHGTCRPLIGGFAWKIPELASFGAHRFVAAVDNRDSVCNRCGG